MTMIEGIHNSINKLSIFELIFPGVASMTLPGILNNFATILFNGRKW